MKASTRKGVGCAVILAYFALYAAAATMLGEWVLARVPAWGAFVYFAIAGVAWGLPLKPLFDWMNRAQR